MKISKITLANLSESVRLSHKPDIIVLCTALLLCLALWSCGSASKKGDSQTVPVIDWNEKLSKTKLNIEDLANVKYIPLETNDSCLIYFITGAAFGDDVMVLTDLREQRVLIFDYSGKYLGKIDHKGGGPEEYPIMNQTAADFVKKEIYVYCMLGNRIFVYDFDGNFLRKINIGRPGQFDDFYNYNDSSLIAYDKANLSLSQAGFNDEPYRYITINKISGEVSPLPIRIDHPIGNTIKWRRSDVLEVVKIAAQPIMCDKDRFVIVDFASDTIFEVKDSQVNILACQKNIDREREIPDRVTIEAAFGDLLILSYVRVADVSNKGISFDEEIGGSYAYNLNTQELTPLDIELPYLKKVNNVNIMNYGVQADKTVFFRQLSPETLLEYYENGNLKGPLLDVVESLDVEANPILMIATFEE